MAETITAEPVSTVFEALTKLARGVITKHTDDHGRCAVCGGASHAPKRFSPSTTSRSNPSAAPRTDRTGDAWSTPVAGPVIKMDDGDAMFKLSGQ